MYTLIKKFFISSKAFLKTFSSKKSLFAFSFAILFLYSALIVFAIPPASPYAVGDNITDPACPPNSLNCYVTSSSGVGIGDLVSNGTPSSILYLDGTGNLTQDSLFTRDVNRNTFIGKDIQSNYTQNIMTVGPTIVSDTPVGTFQQGETIVGQTSGFTAIIYDAHALPDPPQWLLSLSTSTGTFQQGETIVGQTSGATATVGLFSDAPFSNGSSFTVLDINNNLNQIAQGVITDVLGGGQYSYTLNSGSVVQGGIVLDNPNSPTVISHVMSVSSNQIAVNNQASFQLGTLLSGILPGSTQGVGNFYTDAGSGFVVGQWVGEDGGGNNNTFNQTAFDMVNTRGVFMSGVLGNAGTSPSWNVGVVDVPNNWTGGVNITQDGLEISHTNEIGLFANRIVVGTNANSPAYTLPSARGTAGQVLMDVNGDGNLTWQTISGGGGSTYPGGNGGSIQYNNNNTFTGDNDLVWDYTNKKLGVGLNNPYARLSIKSLPNNINQNITFLGTGLNDGTYSGAYTGTSNDTFTVTIDSTSPSGDTFSWSSNSGSGSGVAITGSAQYLADGISITFASTTGHTMSNQWFYNVYISSASYFVNPDDLTWSGPYTGNNTSDSFSVSMTAVHNYEITYSGLTGNFQVGSTVQDSQSSAQAGIVSDDGSTMIVHNTSGGTFSPGDFIHDANTAATAQIVTVTQMPDQFSWSSGNSGGGSDVEVTGGSQLLANGISIQFGSVYGHDYGGIWTYNYQVGQSQSVQSQNDGSFGGTYTGPYTNDTFTVTIDSTSPSGDTFSWSSNSGSSSNIPITGSYQPLVDGIGIQFNTTTGHTVGNQWQLSISPGSATTSFQILDSNGSSNVFTVDGSGATNFASQNINIGGVSYVFPASQSAGAGYVLTNDGNGTLTWTAPAGGGSSPFTLSNSGTLYSSGYGTTGNFGDNNFFVGDGAGENATGTNYSNFIGFYAGSGADNVQYSNFFGYQAGKDATSARDSNFFGVYSGMNATNAEYSNFMGRGSGTNATGANNSNFFGYTAGAEATNAYNSNFIGPGAGYAAIGANNSNFIGNTAGLNATNATYANFFGYSAGDGATDATGSNFLGYQSGQGATMARYSNFFGQRAGQNATNADHSNFLGLDAGNGATSASYSNFLGSAAGANAANSNYSNFLGYYSGFNADSAFKSNFLGFFAGHSATNADHSNFFGESAGYGATSANLSNFFGRQAGANATSAFNSNFIGVNSGQSASAASYANFIGSYAGYQATNATQSNFIGLEAGRGATNASNSIFIGVSAGRNDGVDNVSSSGTSILIGNNTSTGGFSNSIALGASATNTATNQFALSNAITNVRWRGITYTLPAAQAGGSGYVLSNNGSGTLSWIAQSIGLPSQTGNSGKYLTTDGSTASWQTIALSPITLGTNNTTLYSSGISGTGQGDTTNGKNIFLGANAGNSASTVTQSNFLGYSAGNGATDASGSNFFGTQAGYGATGAGGSNFFGPNAGNGATDASGSNFFGQSAGNQATNAHDSNFLGLQAGEGATDAYYSNFIGYNTGINAFNASDSNFLGRSAGYNAVNSSNSNFFGVSAGNGTTDAPYSNFFGSFAGQGAINSSQSNFFGASAGISASNAAYSNFFGSGAGTNADGSSQSNFIGREAGYASTAPNSNFIGAYAGRTTNASYSNFIGYQAGYQALNAVNSIFIGTGAGLNDTVDNTTNGDDYSILLGNYTSSGGFKNSIALGEAVTNTASNQFMIGSTIRPINSTRINGSASTQCTITTGTGIACTSDERLKTNITDLDTDTLNKVLNLKTVTYNWIQNPDSAQQIGFLAQDLEQYFPQLVATDSTGYKSVYYSQITPVLVEAIREMNMKVVDLNDLTKENTWRDAMISWLGNASNKITRIFTGELCLYDENGQTECINASQLRELKQNLNTSSPSTPPVVPPTTPDSTPLTCTTPQILNQAGDACIDPVTDTPPSDTGDQSQGNSDNSTPTE